MVTPSITKPRPQTATMVVAVAVLVFAITMSFWSITKAGGVDAYAGGDLGNMWQSIWNAVHGHGWTYTDITTGIQVSRLSVHADYLLLLLTPTGLWVDGWKILLISQASAVALTAWALYWCARRMAIHLWLAAIIALGYLAAGPVQFPTLFQFHSILFAPLFLLAMTEAVLAKRRASMVWFWFGLALLCEEQVGFIAGPLLAWLWWQRRQARPAFFALAIGWAWSLLQFGFVIPWHRPAGLPPHQLLSLYFPFLQTGWRAVFQTVLNPDWVFSRLWQINTLRNIGLLLLPLGGLALLSPLVLLSGLAVIPLWLSDAESAHSLFFQHHVLALPIVALAGLAGLKKIWPVLTRHLQGAPIWLGSWLIICTLVGTVFNSVFPWSRVNTSRWWFSDTGAQQWMNKVDQLPRTASIAYSPGLSPAVRTFPLSSALPVGITTADYVIFFHSRIHRVADTPDLLTPQDRSETLQPLVAATSAFSIVTQDSRGTIYHRLRPLSPAEAAALTVGP